MDYPQVKCSMGFPSGGGDSWGLLCQTRLYNVRLRLSGISRNHSMLTVAKQKPVRQLTVYLKLTVLT